MKDRGDHVRALGGFPLNSFGFERTNFGIIHIRTDGERVLVFTHSGKKARGIPGTCGRNVVSHDVN